MGSAKTHTITTPIFYVNGAPHIGHVYSAVIADAAARALRLRGESVLLSTGTDEHGIKVQDAAQAKGVPCAQLCDDTSQQFRALFDAFGISYDDYVRTTEARHAECAAWLWQRLSDNGLIYSGKYAGWYCKSDEAFLTDGQVLSVTAADGSQRKVSVESGHPVEWIEEENYMFRLSQFQQPLLRWLDSDPAPVRPRNRLAEVRAFVQSGMGGDLSVSRPQRRIQWALPVPGDAEQGMYVWIDALSNYLTVCGFPHDQAKAQACWPAAVHVVGKDITRFHCVYWPAFLLGAGLPLPKLVLAHSHWTAERRKMSKSVGNVVDPAQLLQQYGCDSVRYYLLRDGGMADDVDFSTDALAARVDADMVNTLGNLASRCTAPVLMPGGCWELPTPGPLSGAEEEFAAQVRRLPELAMAEALEHVMRVLRDANVYFNAQQPWTLKPDPAASREAEAQKRQRLSTVQHLMLETLRVAGILLQPAIPGTATRLLDHLSVPAGERTVDAASTPREPGSPIASSKLMLVPRLRQKGGGG